MPNAWNDYLAGTDEFNIEEIMTRLQETYRALSGSTGWGRPILATDYDGLDPNVHAWAQDTTESLFAVLENHDSSVKYQGNNDGHAFNGPFGFTGNGEVTGDVVLTGDLVLTGDFTQEGNYTLTGDFTQEGNYALTGDYAQTGNFELVGPMDVDGLLHVVGPVTFDDTLDVAGIATFLALVNAQDGIDIGSGNFTIDADGNADAGSGKFTIDASTGNTLVGGTLTIAGNIINDTTLLVTDTVNNKVAVGIAPVSTDAMFKVAGKLTSSAATGGPTAGSHLEMYYSAGVGGVVQAWDRSGAAALPLYLSGSPVVIGINAAQLVGFYGGAGIAQQAAPTAVAASGADATYGATEQAMINEHATAINEIIDILTNLTMVA